MKNLLSTLLERFKSPVACAAIVAQVVTILIMTNVIDLQMGDQINQIAAALLQLGVLLGVLNNPTDSDNF